MSKKEKTQNPEHMGAKEVVGVSLLSSSLAVGSIFMSTMLMGFLTDFAGLGSMGATLATTLLLAARIIDAVDDPIQGMIMDGAKPTKFGKYKPFFLISTIAITIGIVALYALPDAIASSAVLVTAWVIFFYLIYDIGTSFNNGPVLYRTMTNDVNERNKLVLGPRYITLGLSVFSAGLSVVLVALANSVGSYKVAYGIMASAMALVACALSIIGWFMVKERHVVENEKDEKVTLKDFVEVIKSNKALRVTFGSGIFTGFIWTLLFAVPGYYIKYAYCANLATGEVNMEYNAIISGIFGLLQIVPMLIGPMLATPLLKLFKGDPMRLDRAIQLAEAVCGFTLFALQMLGILATSPYILVGVVFVWTLCIGIEFVPSYAINMEVMDYTVYTTGKERSAITGVFTKFLEKAQSAVSTALVGAILIAIGYSVDSVTGNYTGDLANIPTMLNAFVVVMGLIPGILALIGWFINGRYPITNEVRAEMRAQLAAEEVPSVEAAASEVAPEVATE